MSGGVLNRLDRVLDRAEEPDDVLRDAVAALAAEPGIAWAGVAFVEAGELVLGPSSGTPDPERRIRVPVHHQDVRVGELWVDGTADLALLEEVAVRLSAHVLLGWDTGGEAWEA
jgi:hypothetical protein